MFYNIGEAARFLENHPEYEPVFQETLANEGTISLVGFISDHAFLHEADFAKVFGES